MSKIKITCTAATLRDSKQLHAKMAALMLGCEELHIARIRTDQSDDGQYNITTTYVRPADVF